MEIPRARLADNADLAAGRAPVLSRIIGCHDLHFLHRVHVGDADHGAVRTGSQGGRAVKRDDRILRARSVNLERLAAADGEIEIAHRAAAAHTGESLCHV